MNNKSFDIDADYETILVELAVYPDSRGVRRDTYGFIEDELGLLEESGIYLQKIVEDRDITVEAMENVRQKEMSLGEQNLELNKGSIEYADRCLRSANDNWDNKEGDL